MSYNRKSLFLYALLTCVSINQQIISNDATLTKVTKENFIKEVLQSNSTVIVSITAPWCQPCQQMMPIVEKLVQEFPNIKFVTINVDQESELTTALEVTTVPSFIIFYQGKLVTAFAGQKSYDDFKKIILLSLSRKSK